MKSNPNDAEYGLPEIIFFNASISLVQNKEKFSLNWEVKNTTAVEILKNGVPFLKRSAHETNVMISETYDGRDKEVEYTLTASNDSGQTQSLPVTVTVTEITEKHGHLPEVISFEASTDIVQNKQSFSLLWKVKNATNIELHRNGMVFRKYTADKTSATFSESYDGKDKEIAYTLLASNDTDSVQSEVVTVIVKEKAPEKESVPVKPLVTHPTREVIPEATEVIEEIPPVVPDEMTPIYQSRYQENRQRDLRKIRVYLWGAVVIIFLALLGVIYYFQSKPKILDFDPVSIAEEHSLIIVGKNFPTDTTKFHIIFNKIRGSIQYNTRQLIRVVVPALGTQIGDGNVAVAMVYKGDTIRAIKLLAVTQPVKKQDTVTRVLEEVPIKDSPVQEIVRKPAKTTPVKKVVIESFPAKGDSQPSPVKSEEPKKRVEIDISKLVTVSSNDFRKGVFGGVKNLKITVKNDSQYDLDNVTVDISYQKKSEREVKKEEMVFTDVRAHASSILDAPSTNRGSKVTVSIKSFSSKQLDADRRR
jgi:hypothetical protein